jgi:hypothetical protein
VEGGTGLSLAEEDANPPQADLPPSMEMLRSQDRVGRKVIEDRSSSPSLSRWRPCEGGVRVSSLCACRTQRMTFVEKKRRPRTQVGAISPSDHASADQVGEMTCVSSAVQTWCEDPSQEGCRERCLKIDSAPVPRITLCSPSRGIRSLLPNHACRAPHIESLVHSAKPFASLTPRRRQASPALDSRRFHTSSCLQQGAFSSEDRRRLY